MWGRPKISESQHESPSAEYRNLTPFKMRRFVQLVGPFPVEVVRGKSRARRQWFDRARAESRRFEVFYGYNPRCCFKGTWGKPGTGHKHRWG